MHLQVPTTLSEERNQEFRDLYKEHFGIDLTVEEADAEAYRVMSFIAIIIENTARYDAE